jgi:hypothetical protein
MQRCASKPCLVAWSEVEINDGRKTEGKISAGNLCAVSSPEFRVGVNGVVIQRSRVAHMDVRIDQPGYEKSSGRVYSPGVQTCHDVRAEFNDTAITNNDVRMEQRSNTFRRDHSHIFDYKALVNNALRVRCESRIQENECTQCVC